ncbi:MAG: hydroxymethylglutaryl-CoA reductase, degradative [Candidatus Diapherotrites archaeon]
MGSKISGFYNKTFEERLQILKYVCGLSEEEVTLLKELKPISFQIADKMIENVVGIFGLPLGIATHFLINGKDYLVPMAIEETSVVAAASKGAKFARFLGGFESKATEQIMIGQVQIFAKGSKQQKVTRLIKQNKEKILEIANSTDKILVSYGGGAKDIEIRRFKEFMVLHLLVDVKDAMGANAINTMCERVAPYIEQICKCKTGIKIISNLAIYRLVKARAVFSKVELEKDSSKGVVEDIIKAWKFACADRFRATTHNKGIMNGIDAVAIATGNDFRALEAGAHSYASLSGKYKPLTKYWKDKQGNLVGEIEIPIQVGIVGGSTRVNPMAKLCLKILGVKSAKELAEVMGAVGLAQNFAALYALATTGIQYGHMRLHAKNIAIQAGATGDEIEKVAMAMIENNQINEAFAREILKKIKQGA